MNIGYNYPIINNINLKLTRGQKVAITGCNGIGKSTLLKTIMGYDNKTAFSKDKIASTVLTS